ncbi:MAG TPA: type I methionyl aminopeptidase [Burkholderiales bacterium]|mgnify:CR=1 FL=1|nr:type I methionyl aminopeptidase [Burkholderiales bacterium]
MNIIIKNNYDIENMRLVGKLAAEVLDYITPFVKIGITTNELDKLCHDYIINVQNAYPAPLKYQPSPKYSPYPKSICTSVNSEICHGIPDEKPLKDGDIVNIDVTVLKNGYHGDTSRMYYVGNVSPHAKRLCQITFECMCLGIKQVKPGAYFGDIGHAIQYHAEKNGYSVVQEFCGHGIGTVFHEEPQVLHYGKAKTGEILKSGMIFTIEPMINQGKRHIKFLSDGWTAVTKDRSLSAQWEHTVLVTDIGYEVLTVSAKMPKLII